MRTLGTLQDWLIWDEGLRLDLYHDTRGNWTGGIGHNFSANGLPAGVVASIPDGEWIKIQSQGLALSNALALYNYDIAQAQAALSNEAITDEIGDPRYSALTNMMFNLGAGTFAQFTTFIGYVRQGNWAYAAGDLLNNTAVAKQLPARYQRIANALESGTWPNVP